MIFNDCFLMKSGKNGDLLKKAFFCQNGTIWYIALKNAVNYNRKAKNSIKYEH